jgi:hypothetical protein
MGTTTVTSTRSWAVIDPPSCRLNHGYLDSAACVIMTKSDHKRLIFMVRPRAGPK